MKIEIDISKLSPIIYKKIAEKTNIEAYILQVINNYEQTNINDEANTILNSLKRIEEKIDNLSTIQFNKDLNKIDLDYKLDDKNLNKSKTKIDSDAVKEVINEEQAAEELAKALDFFL